MQIFLKLGMTTLTVQNLFPGIIVFINLWCLIFTIRNYSFHSHENH